QHGSMLSRMSRCTTTKVKSARNKLMQLAMTQRMKSLNLVEMQVLVHWIIQILLSPCSLMLTWFGLRTQPH
ncbi:hypothetical protein C0991_004064, partial [Blastosporella zonata]